MAQPQRGNSKASQRLTENESAIGKKKKKLCRGRWAKAGTGDEVWQVEPQQVQGGREGVLCCRQEQVSKQGRRVFRWHSQVFWRLQLRDPAAQCQEARLLRKHEPGQAGDDWAVFGGQVEPPRKTRPRRVRQTGWSRELGDSVVLTLFFPFKKGTF